MKLLVPLVFAVAGVGAGVGAGVALKPSTAPGADHAAVDEGKHDAGTKSVKEGQKDAGHAKSSKESHGKDGDAGSEYVHLKNQFIVPVLRDAEVRSFVILALDLEVAPGSSETVNRSEPKIRDALLTVLFDHANAGGFDGRFTSSGAMNNLRTALREAGRKAVGDDILTDILITSVVRQNV